MATAAEEWSALGFALGRRAGLLVALRLGLAVKFGNEGLLLLPAMSEVEDPKVLYTLCEGIKVARDLTELRELFAVLTTSDQHS